MSSFDDLPLHRRNGWILRNVDNVPHDDMEDLVLQLDEKIREQSQISPCRWEVGPGPLEGKLQAIRGDDGRYHLCADGIPQCTGQYNPAAEPSAAGVYRHDARLHWWTDGSRYGMQPPKGMPYDREQIRFWEVSWLVTLGTERAEPAAVRPRLRCADQAARGQWASYADPGTPIGRVRAVLASELGGNCHACGRRPGTDIDHDPLSLRVRGLLCKTCNNNVETCPHASGCPWGDYLNDPPAYPLNLIYPRAASAHRYYQAKVAALGFDPFPRRQRDAGTRPGYSPPDLRDRANG